MKKTYILIMVASLLLFVGGCERDAESEEIKMAVYKEDIAVVELESGTIHRTFMNHTIGSGDAEANRFGVRVMRNGEDVDLTGVSCFGYFRNAEGTNIALTSEGTVNGNVAYVTLPQACYNVEGQFTLSIKLIGGGVTGTMRIVDGVVNNTNTGGAVAPTEDVPTYTEILAVYDQMLETVEDYAETVAEQNKEILEIDHALSGLADSVDAYKVKNLFDVKILSGIKYANQNVYSVNDDSVSGNFTDSNNPANVSPMIILSEGTYTVSVSNACRIQVFADGTQKSDTWNTKNVTFTIDAASEIYFKFIASSYPYTFGRIQLEVGSNVTEYVRYENPVYYSAMKRDTVDLIAADRLFSTFALRVSDEVSNQGTIGEGVYNYTTGEYADVGYHSTLSVNGGEQLFFHGYCYGSAFPAVVFLYNGDVIGTVYKASGEYYGNISVPVHVDTVIVNGNTDDVIVATIGNNGASGEGVPALQYIDNAIKKSSITPTITGKKIVWFGTSIPAGGYIGADVSRNYPAFIAEKYGCTIYNEAVGSSCAHCKELNEISEENPYGFNRNYVLSSRCLSNTETEMQWMIDHYNDSFWTNKPTLTDQYKTEMLSFSYETKLDKYLTESMFPDLFVFDHGYNDYVTTIDNYTGHEFEPYTLQGALNFLIRRIYSYRPDAKIVIIGNYKYQTRNGLVVEAQKAVAQRWDIQIFDNWHHTGLSDEQAYCSFTWVNSGGTWTKQAAASHLETITNILLPDGVHPHSRPDNLIINRMANAIGGWLAANMTFDN